MNKATSEKLVVSAMLLAIAVILSIVKLAELPYGGSITLASMLPVVIISYRYGMKWGLLSGLVYGLLQLALGTHVFTYVSGAVSVIAVIVLDYLLAFMMIGFSALGRKFSKNQAAALLSGSLIAALLRYFSHVISGATVWAGLSIPTEAALKFSLIYNATYMLPELLILLITAFYIGSMLNFDGDRLSVIRHADSAPGKRVLLIAMGLILLAAAVFDIAAVFSKLQNAESGEFDIAGLSSVNWTLLVIITAVALAASAVLFFIRRQIGKPQEAEKPE